jgi:hypothetical protein
MDDPLAQYFASPNIGPQGASVIQIDSNRLVAPLVFVAALAISLAAISLGMAIGARDTAARAERESRLQRLETDELRAALSRAGIRTHDDTDKP